jgi:hypothetical protein
MQELTMLLPTLSISETILNWVYFVVLIGGLIIFILSFITVMMLVSSWVITNIIRFVNHMEDKCRK